jgi:tellurium resistance protein TerD
MWRLRQDDEIGTKMALSLTKDGSVSLSGSDPGLKQIAIGMGWQARDTEGEEFDLDASAFLLDGKGKVPSQKWFVFYDNILSPDGSVVHTGDNRTGNGNDVSDPDKAPDDETITVSLERIPAEVQAIAITVTIHEAEARKQNFGMVRNAFIRIENKDTGREIARYDLSEDYATETAVIFGEVYRRNGEWKFKAVGQGYSGGLRAMCYQYGVPVAS